MIHFISDLHLSSQTPGIARRFLDYLDHEARQAERLFILGDLFEVWAGDDCIDDPEDNFNRKIVEALRILSNTGVGLSVMHGNRDFLLGESFANRCGAQIISDPYLLRLSGKPLLLTHGDILCTADHGYQAFRAEVRNPAWQTAFMTRSLSERKAIATALRLQSERSKEEKLRQQHSDLMDIDPTATGEFLRDHDYVTLIHGHTHKPARHEQVVDGKTVERWVLADWHEDHGEFLSFDGAQFRRQTL